MPFQWKDLSGTVEKRDEEYMLWLLRDIQTFFRGGGVSHHSGCFSANRGKEGTPAEVCICGLDSIQMRLKKI